jgi:hypothetical protein
VILPIRLLLGTILAIIISWIIIHLLAIFGVFLSFGYLISWLLFPEFVHGILRQLSKRGAESKEILPPPNFKKALANAGLILLLSILSMGLIFIEGKLILSLDLFPTQKTVSFIIPPKGQYRIDEIFPMRIEISGIKVPINAVQVDVGFPIDRLEVANISTQESFAEVFIQKDINNKEGWARLTGGIPNPGYQSEKGVFGTFYFKGKQPGLAKVEFLPSSMVLANDGKGSNVLKDFGSTSFLILPEEVSEEEKELQTVFLQEQVLGEQTDETKLKFYEEGKILGEKIEEKSEPKQKMFIVPLIKFIDQAIFSFWGSIYNFLFGK